MIRRSTELSSSSTLRDAVDLLANPVDSVVGPHFPMDEEEQQLQERLQAIGFLTYQDLDNLVNNHVLL